MATEETVNLALVLDSTRVVEGADKAAKATEQLTGAADKAAESVDKLGTATDGLAAKQKTSVASTESATKAAEDAAKAADEHAKALERRAEAARKFAEEEEKLRNDPATKAREQAFAAEVALRRQANAEAALAAEVRNGIAAHEEATRAVAAANAAGQAYNATLGPPGGGGGGSIAATLAWAGGIAAVSAAFTALVTLMKHAVEVFAEAEAVEIRLEAMIRATGNAAQRSAEQIGEMAKEIQRTTTFSDVQFKDAATSMMKFAGVSGPMFDRAMKAATDLAALTGGDLKSAVETVGRAMENSYGASMLRRMGLLTDAQVEYLKSLRELGAEEQARSVMLGLIEDKAGGLAQAIGERGLASSWKQLRNELASGFEDWGKSIEQAGSLEHNIRALTETMRSLREGNFRNVLREYLDKPFIDGVNVSLLTLINLINRLPSAKMVGGAQQPSQFSGSNLFGLFGPSANSQFQSEMAFPPEGARKPISATPAAGGTAAGDLWQKTPSEHLFDEANAKLQAARMKEVEDAVKAVGVAEKALKTDVQKRAEAEAQAAAIFNNSTLPANAKLIQQYQTQAALADMLYRAATRHAAGADAGAAAAKRYAEQLEALNNQQLGMGKHEAEMVASVTSGVKVYKTLGDMIKAYNEAIKLDEYEANAKATEKLAKELGVLAERYGEGTTAMKQWNEDIAKFEEMIGGGVIEKLMVMDPSGGLAAWFLNLYENAKLANPEIKAFNTAMESGAKHIISENAQLQNQIDATKRATAAIGASKVSQDEYAIAVANTNVALAEQNYQNAVLAGGNSEAVLEALRKQIDLQKQLRDALTVKRDQQVVADAEKERLKEATKVNDEINRTLTDALMRAFEHGKGFAEAFRDTVISMFKTMILRPTISAIMTPISSAVGGVVNSAIGGITGNVATSAGGQVAGNLLGNYAYNSTIGAFMAGYSGLGSAAAAPLIYSAIPEAALVSGAGLAQLPLVGTGAATIGGAEGGIMAGLGAIGPVGWGIIAATVIGGLFASGMFDEGPAMRSARFGSGAGTTYNPDFQGRSAFGQFGIVQGSDQWFSIADQKAQWDQFAQSIQTVDNAIAAMVGPDTTKKIKAALDAATTEFQAGMEHEGMTFGEVLRQRYSVVAHAISDELGTLVDAFEGTDEALLKFVSGIVAVDATLRQMGAGGQQALFGQAVTATDVVGLTAAGEDIAQTFADLVSVFQITNTIARLMGKSVTDVFGAMGLAGKEMRDAFVDAMGGIQAATDKVGYFFQNFYSETERNAMNAADATERIAAVFGDLGAPVPTSLLEFRNFLNSITDPDLYARVIALAPDFVTLYGTMDQAADKAKELARALQEMAEANEQARVALRTRTQNSAAAQGNLATDYASYTSDKAYRSGPPPMPRTFAGWQQMLDAAVSPEDAAKVRHMIDEWTAFYGTAEQVESAMTRLNRVFSEDLPRAIDLASGTQMDAWAMQGEELNVLISTWDGSIASLEAITSATEDYHAATVQMIAAIKQVKIAIHDMFQGSIRSMTMQTLDTGGQYSYMNAEATRGMKELEIATDPARIQALSSLINEDLTGAFNLLSPEQQKAMLGQFIAAAEKADKLAQDRLKEAERIVQARQDALFDRAHGILTDAGALFGVAGTTMLAAANVLAGAAGTPQGVAPTPTAAAAPTATASATSSTTSMAASDAAAVQVGEMLAAMEQVASLLSKTSQLDVLSAANGELADKLGARIEESGRANKLDIPALAAAIANAIGPAAQNIDRAAGTIAAGGQAILNAALIPAQVVVRVPQTPAREVRG